MQNRFFGDCNDYIKYGLLRALLGEGPHKTVPPKLNLLVAWMHTINDSDSSSANRGFYNYPEWKHIDPMLCSKLEKANTQNNLNIAVIEKSKLLRDTKFYGETIEDSVHHRINWLEQLCDRCQSNPPDVIFLDPDNGFEVPSTGFGCKCSSRYIYWQEIQRLWETGASLLIYQHYPRKNNEDFVSECMQKLANKIPGMTFCKAFPFPSVVFFLAGQSRHVKTLQLATRSIEKTWGLKFKDWANGSAVS